VIGFLLPEFFAEQSFEENIVFWQKISELRKKRSAAAVLSGNAKGHRTLPPS